MPCLDKESVGEENKCEADRNQEVFPGGQCLGICRAMQGTPVQSHMPWGGFKPVCHNC